MAFNPQNSITRAPSTFIRAWDRHWQCYAPQPPIYTPKYVVKQTRATITETRDNKNTATKGN
jgi:hypothetical protein